MGRSEGPVLKHQGRHKGKRDAGDRQQQVTEGQVDQQQVGDGAHTRRGAHRNHHEAVADEGGGENEHVRGEDEHLEPRGAHHHFVQGRALAAKHLVPFREIC